VTLKPNLGSANSFFVKHWGFFNSLKGQSGDQTYPWVNFALRTGANLALDVLNASSYNFRYADVVDIRGIAGQGNRNPASIFNNHQVVRIDGTYYDPSGGASYPDKATLETTIIEGYSKFDAWTQNEGWPYGDLNGNGVVDTGVPVWRFRFRRNPAGDQLKPEPEGY
jgi:hypothetical protein